MDLSEYAEALGRELTGVTRFAGEDVSRAAEMLAQTLDSSVRLALLDVLSAAAEEITASLHGATVEVRLTGAQPEFVVSVPEEPEETLPDPVDGDETGNARVTLRLSDSLKARVEAAAAGAGQSVNAWLVRAVGRALDAPASRHHGTSAQSARQPGPPPPPFPPPPGRRPGHGKRYTGFARS